MQLGLKGAFDCVKAVSETDLTEDFKKVRPSSMIPKYKDQFNADLLAFLKS